jgi:hypothetical protein
MRTAVLTLLGSLALIAAAMPANAGPTVAKPGAPTMSNMVEVSGGCAWGYYRDIYGYCQPYNYGYAAAYGYPHWQGHHWGHGHHGHRGHHGHHGHRHGH